MKLKIPPGEFKAYLFDCDGTLADSMPLHFLAWQHALKEEGATFTEELFYQWAGMPTHEIVQQLNGLQSLNMNPEKVNLKRESYYLNLLPTVKPVQAVVDFLRALPINTPKVVVSGSPRLSVMETIRALRIETLFEHMVCAEDYVQGKPHPECFLLAAQKVATAPQDCLVFEDANLGIQAAQAAGMSWVKV